MITAAQARAVSDLARKHEQERAELQERQFQEMTELREKFGWPSGKWEPDK